MDRPAHRCNWKPYQHHLRSVGVVNKHISFLPSGCCQHWCQLVDRPPRTDSTSSSRGSPKSCELRWCLPLWANTTCDGGFDRRRQRPRCSHRPRAGRHWTSCRYHIITAPSLHNANLCSALYGSCKHDTTHICCQPPWCCHRGCQSCNNQSISPACQAHSSKPAACCCSGRQLGQTDGRTPYPYIDPATYHVSSVNKLTNLTKDKLSSNICKDGGTRSQPSIKE